ncbi:MAG: DUF1203 domain-containing protein [Erythrobacter sp.]
MTYLIEGLDPAPFRPLFELGEAELAARGIVRVVADAAPGYPCRVTLEDAQPGERLLLLNHESRSGESPYRARHAIFVRETAQQAAVHEGQVPEVFVPRQLSLRGFDAAGMMVDAMIAEPGTADEALRAMFDDPRIVEIDVHNAIRGCFSARARRMP